MVGACDPRFPWVPNSHLPKWPSPGLRPIWSACEGFSEIIKPPKHRALRDQSLPATDPSTALSD